MPLSKARMRERKRKDRGNVKPASNPNPSNPMSNPVKPNGLIMKKNRIIGVKPKQVAQVNVKPNPIVKPEYVIIGGVRYKKPG